MASTSSFCTALCLFLFSVWFPAYTPTEAQEVEGRQKVVEMYESLCVLQGGVCRYVSDCPSGQLTSIKGLCPAQKSMGVECCYTGRKVRREVISCMNGICSRPEDCRRLASEGWCHSGSVCCSENVRD